MRVLVLAPLLLQAVLASELLVGNTTTYVTLHNKNAYVKQGEKFGVGNYAPDNANPPDLTVQQCMTFCAEDPRCDCVTQSQGDTPDSKTHCWRHNDCNPGGFVSEYNQGYDVHMEVVTPWLLQGLQISSLSTFVRAEEEAAPQGGFAVSRETVSAFALRSRSGARMSLVNSSSPDGLELRSVELLANGTVSIPGYGLRNYSWEDGVAMLIEPGQPWQAIVDLGYERLPLAGAITMEALHAKVVLEAGGDAELLAVAAKEINGSEAAVATTVTYETLWDKNAYKGFGAEPVQPGSQSVFLTEEACQDACTKEPICECATWRRSSQKCWLRKDCNPAEFNSDYNEGYNVFMKITTDWLQAGMSVQNNSFTKVVGADARLAVAVSKSPLANLTVGLGWCGQVGLSFSDALEDAGSGYVVNVSDDVISIPNQGQGALQLPYTYNADIHFYTANGEVFVELPQGRDHFQYYLGPSPGAMYGKIVLQEAGASASVRSLAALAPPTPSPTPAGGAEDSEWQPALFAALGALLLVSVTATLAAVCWRRRRALSAAGAAGAGPGARGPFEDGGVLPTLLGCKAQSAGSHGGLAAASMDKHIANPAWAAISLEQLNDLREKAKRALGKDFKDATMHDVSAKVLQPIWTKHGLSYAHYVNGSRLLKVDTFVSHTWQANFDEFVTSVNSVFTNWPVKPNLWICATALLHAPKGVKTISPQASLWEDPSQAPFIQALDEATKLLVVRNSAVDLFERVWCCWELYCAHKRGLLEKPGALILAGPMAFRGAQEVDLSRACAKDPEDKRRILLHVLKAGILSEVNRCLTELAFRRDEAAMVLP